MIANLLIALFIVFYSAEARFGQESINSPTESIKCSLCHLIVTYVEEFVAKNATTSVIIRELEDLCKVLPSGFRPDCDTIVQQYAPKLIQWVIKKENPDQFCSNVHLCTSTVVPKIEQDVKISEDDSEDEENTEVHDEQSVTCAICQTVILYVEKWVQENSTETAIVDRLQTYCSALGSASPECKSLVATYLPQMITHVLNREDPLTFCSQIRICTTRSYMKRNQNNQQQGACEICQMIVTYVEQLVAQNTTVNKIVSKVEEVCALLPGAVAPICDQIAKDYVPQLVQWIINKENPQAFCAHFGLC